MAGGRGTFLPPKNTFGISFTRRTYDPNNLHRWVICRIWIIHHIPQNKIVGAINYWIGKS